MAISLKRPDKDDAMTLIPVAVTVVLFLVFTNRRPGTHKTMLIPAVVAATLWVALKGLRYVPTER